MSIPTSLIVVVLVLAWLMVLVPMVARRREAVPEAEMAGGTFRVLQRSGEGPRRRPSFRRRPTADTDDSPEDVAGEPVADDQELDEELLDDEYDDSDEYDGDDDDTDEYGDEYGADDTDRGEIAAPVAAPTRGFRGRRSTGSHPYQADDADQVPQPTVAVAATAVAAPYESQPARYESEPARYEPAAAHSERDTAYDESSVARDRSTARPAPAEHADDLHLQPIPRRPGRGGYDPDAAEIARKYKYSRRRRVAVVLLLAALLFSAAAVLINPVLWAGTAVFGLLLIGYLAYLRRQVQIEASIRERRLARLRRARQIRPEYDMDRADMPVNGSTFARGAVPASQVPAAGLRRGREIVDLDDDDPAFEDLEYYQPVTYRQAAGQ